MKRLLSIVFLLLFMALGVAIAIVNAETVEFNYYFGTISQPLSILLVGAILIGALLATLINGLVILGLRHQLRRTQRQIKKAEETSVSFFESTDHSL